MSDRSTKGDRNPAIGYAISGMDSIKAEAIPSELKALPQWVAWKSVDKGDGKKATKIPVNPSTGGNARSNDPGTWGKFEEAARRATCDRLAGIGLMFDCGDLVGIDLDDVVDDGRFTSPLAEAFVRGMDTYTEISPSGRGVKMWLRSSVHPGKCTGTISKLGESVGYETYHKGRWFAVTGHAMKYGKGRVQERTKKFAMMLEMGAKPKAVGQATGLTGIPAMGDAKDEEAMLRAALGFLDADSESTWFRIGCALKSWSAEEGVGDAKARALWDEWSKGSPKYDLTTQGERWNRMEPDKGLTIGTIFKEAGDEGYRHGDAIGPDGAAYRVAARPGKPTVELHSVGGWSHARLTDAARQLGDALSGCGELFARNGAVVYVEHGATVPVEAHDLAAIADRHANLVIRKETKGKDGAPRQRLLPTSATQGQCQDILAAKEFRDSLPQLRLISRCPVLVDDGRGGLRAVVGYDRDSGVLSTGGDAAEVPIGEAKRLLADILADFDFDTPSDRSRAIAAMVTPAMVMGGLLPGRAPVDLGEADHSQAGKGYRQKILTAIYNDSSASVLQRKGGTGSLEESYSAALIGGSCFIMFDNVRGKIDSPMLESSMTECFCDARMPYGRPMQVDMRRVCVSMTSNDARLTGDLSKRCSPVKIRKRPDGYPFRTYPEGDAVAHVRASQGLYLGAVFAVVKAWAEAGRPMEADSGQHDFRGWARTMGWIVRDIFGEAPLCDGIRETQERMSNPNRGWAREVAILALGQGRQGEPMRAHQIVRLLEDCGAEVPGIGQGADLSDDENFRRANQGVGRKMASAFGRDVDVLNLDEMTITRSRETDDGKPAFCYVFSDRKNRAPPDGGRSGGSSGGNPVESGENAPIPAEGKTAENDDSSVFPPDGSGIPPNAPPDAPPEKPQYSPDTPDTLQEPWDENQVAPSTGALNLMVRKNGGLQADQAENQGGKRQKNDGGKEAEMAPNTGPIPAKRKTYNTDPIPMEIIAKMDDAEVISGVESGRIFYTALIGRRNPSGKNGEAYDILSAWDVQFQNPAPRDFSWPARPGSAPTASARASPSLAIGAPPADSLPASGCMTGGIFGGPAALLEPSTLVEDWPGV